jgi:hypothetical protein
VASLEAGQVNRDGNEDADMKAIQNQMLVGTAATVLCCVKGCNLKHQAHPQFSLARRNVFRKVNDREWMLSWKSLSNQES